MYIYTGWWTVSGHYPGKCIRASKQKFVTWQRDSGSILAAKFSI